MKRPVPPLFFLVALILEIALGLMPGAFFIAAPWHFTGVVLIAAGLAVAIWGDLRFVRAGTPVHPYQQATTLVVSGPFRFSRNPMYLGMVLVLLGAAVLFQKLLPLTVPFVFGSVISSRFIRAEEARLADQFGEEYADYKRRVRRWI